MLTLLWALTLPALAERAPEVGVVINPLIAVDTAKDRPHEDHLSSWTWIRASVRKPGASGWFLGIDAEHHVRIGEDREATWDVRAGQSGWTGPVGPFHLRAGHLIERWGKLDMLSVADVLNPADLRAGPLSTVEATRIPVPMAVLQLGQGRIRTELVLLPFASADRGDMIGGDWSLIRPGMLTDFLAQTTDWDGSSGAVLADGVTALADGLAHMPPSTLRGVSTSLSQAGQPEADLISGEAAVRLELEGRGIDGAVMAGALRSRSPATTLNPQLRQLLQAGAWPELDELSTLTSALGDPLSTDWPRTWFGGAELSTALGPIGLRAEGAWWSDAVIAQPWLSSTLSPKVSGGMGLDWMHGSALLVSVEGRYTHYTDAPPAMVLMRESQLDLGILTRLSTLSDRLTILAAGMLVPEHSEYLARPEVRYRATDALELGVGAVLIGGSTPPPASLTEAMRYDAGPMANFGENDSVFAQIQWIQ